MEEMKMEEMKMEQKRELKNGLGIASFVIGIIGFLTGFIAIGMYFDIIAVILGVIALVSKKNKKGFAIAGLLIAASGFIIMMFLVDVFDGSDKTKTTKNKSVQTTEDAKDKEADKPTLQTKRKICLQEYLQRALHLMEQRLETFFVCDYGADGKYIIEVGSMFGDTQEVFIDIKK